MNIPKQALLCLGVALMATVFVAPLNAQTYPNRPIRLIVPFPPGGGSDTSARAIADVLTQALGQPIIVENRPGAGTVIAGELVAKARPDGHTLLVVSGDIVAIDQAYGNKLPYDPIGDFTYVSGLSSLSIMLIASPNSGVKTVQELVAKAKASPNRLSFASLGSSSPHFLFFEWFKNLAGIRIAEVPYKGTMQAVPDVLAGRVDLVFIAETNGMRYAEAGKLTPIATTGDKRSVFAPDVPAFAESGFSNLSMYNWFAIAGPAGLPRDVTSRLNTEIVKALSLPSVAQRLGNIGLSPWPTSPEKINDHLRQDVEKYRQIIRLTGAKPEGR